MALAHDSKQARKKMTTSPHIVGCTSITKNNSPKGVNNGHKRASQSRSNNHEPVARKQGKGRKEKIQVGSFGVGIALDYFQCPIPM
jgi:hypothetical protein